MCRPSMKELADRYPEASLGALYYFRARRVSHTATLRVVSKHLKQYHKRLGKPGLVLTHMI